MRQAEERLGDFEAARERLRSTAENAFTGLITGAHDFRSALQMIVADLARMAASRVFQTILSGGSGGGEGLHGLLGFSAGGYTGDGSKLEPAGLVHKGEFVVSKEATRRIGVGNLEALHSAALRGYSDGGLVGSRAPVRGASVTHTAPEPTININAPVSVNASGGTPQQNADLAKRMSKEMEATMRGTVVDELRKQMRPGNMLNRGDRK